MYIKLLSLLTHLPLCCVVGWEIEIWLRGLITSLSLVSFTEARRPGRAVRRRGFEPPPGQHLQSRQPV
ncbi:hypothetical protein TESG_00331 [Trichophyton tonsurans CBS 112818]|uniref:Secreted protein n=2 Tax=Trichophyton TaxID=5550 RepID=F2PU05_TRIEC|nr:hypothetical protein TESG_00331 [Trichophyton tonsurans CBS 112818]EGE05373.1 hypothetical protein TEQG_04253 [Trichophyton equinum CBS 127.97]